MCLATEPRSRALSLRILHLEDDPNDAELIRLALARDEIDCEVIRAASRVQFVEAIDGTYDLILADYALPGFDGVSAQRIARERRPDLPFVFVSGTIGEEVAVERLKEGATDYVLKQKLSRLPSAVRRALQEAQNSRARRQAQDEIRQLNATLEQRVVERTTQLAQATAFLDSIVENLPDMVFVKDARELRFVRVNRAGEEMLGLRRGELIGRSDEELFPAELAEAFTAADRQALAARTVIEVAEDIVETPTRGSRVLHTKKIPIISAATGEPEYLLGISRDITDRKAAEEVVRLAKVEAERASRAKSEFLSRMSHDLRTPLNAILGFAQLLEMDGLASDQSESVRQILNGGRHLLELINEVLDIARIEAGHLSLSPEPVAVSDVVVQVTDLVRPLGASRGITVTSTLSGDASALHVQADRQRLTQVLMNLVANAVKYNRDGGSVRVSCAATADRIRVAVTDTGAGIPPEKLALLFQPFERLGADQSAIEGTGLGLAVSKGLAEAMGGAIGVESVIDGGSTFWVELPRAHVLAAPESSVAAPDGERHEAVTGTVLYIEDNRSNIRLLERLLARRRGVRLLASASGEEGVVIARAEHPDLILLDLHLPDVPGDEVLRRLWAHPSTRGIPVAVLSADATTRQSQRLLAAGAVAYLTKPLELTRLLKLLDDILPVSGSVTTRRHCDGV